MIQFNFDRTFKARGIMRPFSFLKQAGFSDGFATKIKNNKATIIRHREMEKLCLLLHCTPNDFYEWIPDSSTPVEENHPMHKIRKNDKVVDITQTLNSVPFDQLEKIDLMIKNQIKEGENK